MVGGITFHICDNVFIHNLPIDSCAHIRIRLSLLRHLLRRSGIGSHRGQVVSAVLPQAEPDECLRVSGGAVQPVMSPFRIRRIHPVHDRAHGNRHLPSRCGHLRSCRHRCECRHCRCHSRHNPLLHSWRRGSRNMERLRPIRDPHRRHRHHLCLPCLRYGWRMERVPLTRICGRQVPRLRLRAGLDKAGVLGDVCRWTCRESCKLYVRPMRSAALHDHP